VLIGTTSQAGRRPLRAPHDEADDERTAAASQTVLQCGRNGERDALETLSLEAGKRSPAQARATNLALFTREKGLDLGS